MSKDTIINDTPINERLKAEQGFINEQTRVFLVKWADYQVMYGRIPLLPEWGRSPREKAVEATYLKHAQTKGWVSKDGTKVTAKGFSTAAAFLRR